MRSSNTGLLFVCALLAGLVCPRAVGDTTQTVNVHNNNANAKLKDVVISASSGKITKVTDNGKFTSPAEGSNPNSASVKFDGADMAKCESTSIIVDTERDKPGLKILKMSWKDANGNETESAVSPKDDIFSYAVEGGAGGRTWAGVNIGAGEWGYFYQFDRNAEFDFSPDKFLLKLGSAPTSWGVLSNTWDVPLVQADFPLNMVTDGSVTYELDDHMAPGYMTGSAGIAPLDWSYSGGSMVASYSSLFNIGDASSILWFTHKGRPELGGSMGLTGQNAELYAGSTRLFTNGAIAPIPEPSVTALVLVGIGVLLAGRTARGQAR